jgi:hypothetical protein
MDYRMMPPTDVRYQTRTVNGRTYSGTPAGGPQTIPDHDGDMLGGANGWTFIALSGPTSSRPAGTVGRYAVSVGMEYFDTTLTKLIKYDGATWRDPATGAAV